MPRKRKVPVPAPGGPGNAGATLGESIEGTARLARLTEREKSLALRAKTRKRIQVEFSLDEYDEILGWCERWEEEPSVVVRAVVRRGLEHYRGWASENASYSPFAIGAATPRSPSQLDPTGRAFPPPPLPHAAFGQAAAVPPFPTRNTQTHGARSQQPDVTTYAPPPTRETVVETVEPIFGDADGRVQVGRHRLPVAAVLPSAATPMASVEPDPPREAFEPAPAPPQDEIAEETVAVAAIPLLVETVTQPASLAEEDVDAPELGATADAEIADLL